MPIIDFHCHVYPDKIGAAAASSVGEFYNMDMYASEATVTSLFAISETCGISNYVISKMTRNKNITVKTVGKICKALNCTPNDIMEFASDSEI